MTKKSLLFLINLFVFFAFTNASSQTGEFLLRIISENDFELYVNDLFSYRGKEFDTILSAGKYKLEAVLLNSNPKLSVYKQLIELSSDTLIELNSYFPFSLKSRPDNAKVFIDSLFFGYSPIHMNLLFRPKILSLQLDNSEKIFNLEKASSYNFEIDFENYSEKKKSSFGYKYIALTSTIINGILSAYYKQKADKFYYKSDRTQADYELVKKYDNYSAVFTIGMEISFGIFVYLLFKE